MLLVRNKREILADWTRAERAKRKWSQSELADRMGKVRGVINKIESASNDPTLDTLAALAKAFGYKVTTVLDMLGYDVEKEGKDPWVQAQESKLEQIPPEMRPMAARIIEGFVEEEPKASAVRLRKTKSTAP